MFYWNSMFVISVIFSAVFASVYLSPAAVYGQTASEAASEPPADLVLLDGKIVTMDAQTPLASALAVRGDRIAAVGDDASIRRRIGPKTRVIELEGRLAIPGIIEGHAHFLQLGEAKMQLDLTRAKNWDEVVSLAAEAARKAPPGTWIVGRGWHQDKWDRPPEPCIDGCPTHETLSRAVPDHPVLLAHASGHSLFANAKAMQLAGVDEKTLDRPDMPIHRDARGRPTGLFRESMALITDAHREAMRRRTPEEIDRHYEEAARLAAADCLAKGITTLHDAGESPAMIDRLRRLGDEGRLPVRLWVMLGGSGGLSTEQVRRYRIVGACDNHLTVRSIKMFMDGALGSRDAWFLAPYADKPDNLGWHNAVETIQGVARLAIENDMQLCTHAIGDRAIRTVLNIYEEAFQSHPNKHDLRWRIEHVQHIDPTDIPRFSRLGIVAAMQGIHCTSDAPFVVKALGAGRARYSYAWRSLLDAGAVVINGTDAPVEDVDPIRSFHASVARKPVGGPAFFPEECMTRLEALRSYTLNPAYAAFEESLKGSLAPGKLADVTVLSKDILTVPDDEIPEVRAVYTIVGGKVLFERSRCRNDK